jgi:cytochrome c peroxidase
VYEKGAHLHEGPLPDPPLGLPPIDWPFDNPYTPAKAELSKLLFFDDRLSSDGSLSCASCHNPVRAFTDGAPRSVGIGGKPETRNAPTIVNHAFSTFQF